MSVKLRVSGLLASVCLFGVVSGGAMFAQDAVLPAVVVDLPAVAAPEDVVVEAVKPAAVEEPAVVKELAAAAPPAKVALAVPAPSESTGFEAFSDENLARAVSSLEQELGYIEDHFCTDDCDEYDFHYSALRDFYQNELDRANEETRRRLPVVVDTPDTTPAPAPSAAVDRRADATPPAGFCDALAAKGDRSDCGWSYRQSLKQ